MVNAPGGTGRSRARGVRVRVALSADSLCAADGIRTISGRPWRMALDAPVETNGGGWPALERALAELAAAVGVEGGELAISLMPPLTEVRHVELPPLREQETMQLLTRNAARYFVSARGAQLIAVARRERAGLSRARSTDVIAAAVPARLAASIYTAAAAAGWTVDGMGPAEAAWAAAGATLWPVFRRGAAYLLVVSPDRTDLLQLDNGALSMVRRFRGGSADAELIADAVADGVGARVAILGDAASRSALARTLSGRVSLAASIDSDSSGAPDALAARFATPDGSPVFRNEDAQAGRREAARRSAAILTAAAVVMFAVAAGVEYWGVHRQLRAVQAEREALRPQLSTTMVGRTSVDAATRHLAALGAAERSAPHWSTIIGALSDNMPDDAYLSAFHARADSLVIDGLADHAARVFDSIEQAPELTGVHAGAPVRREIQDNGTAREHFTIAARVAPAPVSMAVPAANGARTPVAAAPAGRSGQ